MVEGAGASGCVAAFPQCDCDRLSFGRCFDTFKVRRAGFFSQDIPQAALQHFWEAIVELLKLLPKAIWDLDGDLNRHQKASLWYDCAACMHRNASIVTHCIAGERALLLSVRFLELLAR
jgi:hypothetical protein